MANLQKFGLYQKAQQQTREAREWVKHNNAQGRRHHSGQDVLRLSSAHCSIKLSIAGQYIEGGTNYWESPPAFNSALIRVIIEQFPALASAALAKLEADEAGALVAATEEVAEVNQLLADAQAKEAA